MRRTMRQAVAPRQDRRLAKKPFSAARCARSMP